MSITLHCQTCSLPFQVEPSREHTARFCSNDCKGKAKRTSVVLECAWCHQPFPVQSYRKDTALYCSRTCKHQATQLPEEIDICHECGKPFIVSPTQRIGDTERFCSRKCATISTARSRRGKSLHNFWTRVEQCEHEWACLYCCWPWKGSRDRNGYGHIQVNKKLLYTHRVAWELHNGRELPHGAKIGHYCHFTTCGNPSHIHAGTQKDNIQDSVRDGRHAFGEKNGRRKLTEEEAKEALKLRAAGWSFRKIGAHFGVTHGAIEALSSGKSWKHLPRF